MCGQRANKNVSPLKHTAMRTIETSQAVAYSREWSSTS